MLARLRELKEKLVLRLLFWTKDRVEDAIERRISVRTSVKIGDTVVWDKDKNLNVGNTTFYKVVAADYIFGVFEVVPVKTRKNGSLYISISEVKKVTKRKTLKMLKILYG